LKLEVQNLPFESSSFLFNRIVSSGPAAQTNGDKPTSVHAFWLFSFLKRRTCYIPPTIHFPWIVVGFIPKLRLSQFVVISHLKSSSNVVAIASIKFIASIKI
jgi:hypothetical protein